MYIHSHYFLIYSEQIKRTKNLSWLIMEKQDTPAHFGTLWKYFTEMFNVPGFLMLFAIKNSCMLFHIYLNPVFQHFRKDEGIQIKKNYRTLCHSAIYAVFYFYVWMLWNFWWTFPFCTKCILFHCLSLLNTVKIFWMYFTLSICMPLWTLRFGASLLLHLELNFKYNIYIIHVII